MRPVRFAVPFFAVSLLGVTVIASPGCSSSSPGHVGLSQGCSINSDCDSPLICAFGKCHEQCGSEDSSTRDCPAGERCVASGGYNVCALASELQCSAATPCVTGLVCEVDDQCHGPCSATQGCPAQQSCIGGGCFYATEVDDAGRIVAPDGDIGDASIGDAPGDAPIIDAAPDVPFTPSADAGPLGFTPSNVVLPVPADAGDDEDGGDAGALGPWAGAGDAFVTQTCSDCLPAPRTTIAMNDGSFADVYVLKSLTIEETAQLRLTGPRPVILAVLGAVDIQGQLLVNGVGSTPGPGGFSALGNTGPGGGHGGSAFAGSTAGGGSYCGTGGSAGAIGGPAATPGAPYGSPALIPLIGGSAGYGSGSGGGGALHIFSGTSILVREFGSIHAGGGGGQNNGWSGGASGGAILLEAPSVTIAGKIAANGGGGSMNGIVAPLGADSTADDQPAPGGVGTVGRAGAGSAGATIDGGDGVADLDAGTNQIGAGGGGAGRIRINTASGSATITGIVSPSLATAGAAGTPCATQGTIAP
jgi:hypothetical protein